jgi:hypothetical protein
LRGCRLPTPPRPAGTGMCRCASQPVHLPAAPTSSTCNHMHPSTPATPPPPF